MIEAPMRRCLLLSLALVAGPLAAGDPRPGLAAYGSGDPAAAMATLAPLAEGGDAIAAAALGAMYERGEGVAADPGAARTWYARAAEGGIAVAATRLGMLLEDEGETSGALEWWRRGAAAGEPHAMYNLALRLLRAGTADDAEAAAYMRSAAGTGLAPAQYAWGMLNLGGRGTPVDPAAARAALESAATAGYRPAQHNLALLLEAGIGGPADPDGARSWRALAATRSDSPMPPAPTPAPPDAAPLAAATSTLHDVDWIVTRNPEHYTVQLATGDDEQALVRFLERQSLPGDLAHFRFESTAGPRYSAIYGAWADVADARAALERLPESLQQARPWIRRFRELQVSVPAP